MGVIGVVVMIVVLNHPNSVSKRGKAGQVANYFV